MAEIFLSGKNKNLTMSSITKILCKNKILANITQLKSVVFNKSKNKFLVETAFKIDLFSDELNKEFFKTFMEFRKVLKINCIWINTKTFSNCIMKYPAFIKFQQEQKGFKELFKCSEY